MSVARTRAVSPHQRGRGARLIGGLEVVMAPKQGSHGGPPGPDGPQRPRAAVRDPDTAPFWVAAMAGRLDSVGAAFDEQTAAQQVVYV